MSVINTAIGVIGMPVFWGAIAVIFVSVYFIRQYAAYQRLKHFQGPRWAAWTELWLAKVTWNSEVHTAMREANDNYGSVARIGPNLLITSDPTLLRKIGMAQSRYSRAEWYDAMKFDPRCHNTISEKDEKKHNKRRAILTPGYSGREVPGMESMIDERVMDLVNLIQTKYISTASELKVMDLASVSQYFTLDTLTSIAFGTPFGFIEADDDLHDYIKALGPLMPIMELQSNITWIAKILNSSLIKKLATPTANDGSAMGRMIGFSQSTVAGRFSPKTEEKQDMLGSFIRHGLSQIEAESECLLQVMAGADSTATAIRVIMYFIITNPLVYAKLQKELDAAERKGIMSRPVITDTESRNLPYLQAVIKEGLRAWPPGTGISTKLVPPEGEILTDGRHIPGGTRIGWSSWGTQHSKEVYGDDARIFRPERWLEFEAGDERLVRMERTHELIFASGRYGCLGKTVAFVELNKVFATLLRQFDVSVIDPTARFKSRCNGFFVQSKMFVKVMKRESLNL